MTSHVAILHQLYSELIGNRWELSGVKEYPQHGYYFTPTCLMGLWASIKFGVHHKDGIFTQSAILRLYDPAQKKDDCLGLYLELQAFDAPRFSQSCIQVFIGIGRDPNMRIWSDLVLEQTRALKAKAIQARIKELVCLHSFSLWASELSEESSKMYPRLKIPDLVR